MLSTGQFRRSVRGNDERLEPHEAMAHGFRSLLPRARGIVSHCLAGRGHTVARESYRPKWRPMISFMISVVPP
jgi:hypothetical protein